MTCTTWSSLRRALFITKHSFSPAIMPLDDLTYNIYTRPSIAYVYDYSLFRVFHHVTFGCYVC